MKSPSVDQKSFQASASSFVSVGWDLSEMPWSSSLRSSLLTSCSRLRVGSRSPWSLPNNLAVPSAVGNIKVSPLLCDVNSLRRWISDVSRFSICSISAIIMCPFQILRREQRIFEDSWQNFLTKLVEPWLVSGRNRMRFNHCFKRNHWVLEWFSESPFKRGFFPSARRSGHFAESNSSP